MPSRPTVLIIEDDPSVLDTLSVTIETHLTPSIVITAADLARARRVLATTAPTVILLDLRLPDGDGLTLIREVRLDPRLGATRVIAMTGYDTPTRRAMALAAGCDAYLPKPFAVGALLAAVRGSSTSTT